MIITFDMGDFSEGLLTFSGLRIISVHLDKKQPFVSAFEEKKKFNEKLKSTQGQGSHSHLNPKYTTLLHLHMTGYSTLELSNHCTC